MNDRAVALVEKPGVAPDNNALVDLARNGDGFAIRTIIRRRNRRHFRAARSIVRNDGEAEDVVQASYVKAFTRPVSFRRDSQLSTWLTGIALNEAPGRLRRQRLTTSIEQIDIEGNRGGGQVILFPSIQTPLDPEIEPESRNFGHTAIFLPSRGCNWMCCRSVDGKASHEWIAIIEEDGIVASHPGLSGD